MLCSCVRQQLICQRPHGFYMILRQNPDGQTAKQIKPPVPVFVIRGECIRRRRYLLPESLLFSCAQRQKSNITHSAAPRIASAAGEAQ